MNKAIDVHDHVVRTQLARFNGYEISTEGDAFTIAFHDADDAVAWSIATQQVSTSSPRLRHAPLAPPFNTQARCDVDSNSLQ